MKKLKKEFDKSIPQSPVSFDDIKSKIEYSSSKKKKVAITITSSLVVLTCLGLIVGYSISQNNKINDYDVSILNYGTYIIRDYYRDNYLYFDNNASIIIDKQNGNHLMTYSNKNYYFTFNKSNINEYTFGEITFNKKIEFTIKKEKIEYIINLVNSKKGLSLSLYQPLDNYKTTIFFDLATKKWCFSTL